MSRQSANALQQQQLYQADPGVHYQGGGSRDDRYDDGDSALQRAGYMRQERLVAEGPLGSRIGCRQLRPNDARYKLDRLRLSEILEEQGPPGPICFGPRIMRELPPRHNFELLRSTKMYDGSTRPEDWLQNYLTAVNIAGRNRRWAVRYIPQMLEGPVRLWLNNLLKNSIDCWLDFFDAFITNFTSTYERPNHPQQLAMCKQRENETDW